MCLIAHNSGAPQEGRKSKEVRRAPTLSDRGHANFYEKALFVKATWRLPLGAE
jgi:hypothetical protein